MTKQRQVALLLPVGWETAEPIRRGVVDEDHEIGLPGRHDHQVAEQAVGNKSLGAVEHHVVTILFRQRSVIAQRTRPAQ